MIYINIPGKPISKARPRVTRKRTYDPKAKEKRATSEYMFAHLPIPRKPMTGPLFVELIFTMPRPDRHFRTGKFANTLKDSAPWQHTQKPDIDNLAKFYLDCGNGILWVDDTQIINMHCEKEWADGREDGNVEITVQETR